jgi:tetratricopeptide (TPR) repeat protein
LKKNDRLEALQAFLKETPDDPFLLYGVAIEYLQIEEDKGVSLLEELLQSHPQYLPTYYKTAEVFVEREQYERAKEVYEAGIKLATQIGDNKILSELKSAYQNLLFELD